MTDHLFATAVILAGGSGERFGSGVAKQFLDLAGRPMLAHALLAFEQAPEVMATVVVLPPERPAFVDQELTAFPKVWSVTNGGPTRQASLGEGLICLPDETDVVLVHDAARPAVQPSLIARVIGGLGDTYDGAVPAIPVEDALKEVTRDGLVVGRRSRAGLWRAQTPQGFRRECIEDALARVDADGVLCEDCAEMAVRAGYRVRVVPGDPANLKATRREDLRVLEALLAGSASLAGSATIPGSPSLTGTAGLAGSGSLTGSASLSRSARPAGSAGSAGTAGSAGLAGPVGPVTPAGPGGR